MVTSRTARALLLFLLSSPLVSVSADKYWEYNYRGTDVLSSYGAEYAEDIALKLHRLDKAVTAFLNIRPDLWRAPSSVFLLPHSAFQQIRRPQQSEMSAYLSDPFANTILIDDSEASGSALFAAYYGYTGSILVTAYSFRYPDWFLKGLSELLGASEIRGREVSIGAVDQDRAKWLYAGFPIPVKTLLRMRENDPHLADPQTAITYSAECWLLVHLIMIEKTYQPQFLRYLSLLDQGKEESEAFANSFDIPYEALDKLLRQVLAQGSVKKLTIKIDNDEQDVPKPKLLTPAESTGRIALLAARHGVDLDAAGTLVDEALRLDPDSEDALSARATLQLRRQDYRSALGTGNTLCGVATPSGVRAARCGELFSRLAEAAGRNSQAIDIDAKELAARAQDYYRQAIDANEGDIASWAALTELVASTHDASTAAALRPKVVKVQLKYYNNGELARSLARLCASMNDQQGALEYALVWQRHALNAANGAAAATYVSRLVEALQRTAVAAPEAAP